MNQLICGKSINHLIKILIIFLGFSLVGCAVDPTLENYSQAIQENDLETIKEIESNGEYGKHGRIYFPLHDAIDANQSELFSYFVEKGYDIEGIKYNRTPLSYAAYQGNFAALEKLIELGADLNSPDSNRRPPLGVDSYVRSNTSDAVKIAELLINSGADIFFKDSKGKDLVELNSENEEVSKLIQMHQDFVKTGSVMIREAIQENNVDRVLKLLENKRLINEKISSLPLLTFAVINGNVEIVKTILADGADVNLVNKRGAWTPLLYSIYYNRPEVAVVLIDSGADVNLANNDGWAPLHVTVNIQENQSHDGAKLAEMLIQAGADINQQTNTGRTPLNLSVANNWMNTFKVLLKSQANLNLADSDDWSPLYRAVSDNKPEMVSALIKAGADVNLATSDGWTPLLNAVSENKPEMVSALIKAGADVNLAASNGWAPLHWTVNSKENQAHEGEALAKLLLQAGADINQQTNTGSTPLYLSVANNWMNTFKALLKAKANLNLATNSGWTPLLNAVSENKPGMVSALIKAGADVNLANNNGWAPLHWTVNSKEDQAHEGEALAKLLLQAGADINQQTNTGSTPLYLSVANNWMNTFKALLKAKANLNLATNNGWTPLLNAVSENKPEMVSALIKAGADVNLVNNDYWGPLHWTVNGKENQAHDGHKLAKLLLQAGANINQQTNTGYTPLYLSVVNNRKKEFDVLLKSQPDINKTYQKTDRTLVHILSVDKGDNKEMLRALIKRGANINKKDNVGDTPLMLAAYFGQTGAAKILIEAGADLDAINWSDKQKSALDYAVEKGNYSIADLIRNNNGGSGLEASKYPARPAAKSGYVTCNTKCNNADCYRTYSDGRKVRFQAQQKFNPFTSQWEYDSGTCL